MPYTMEDFEREVAEKVLKKLTPEQRLEGLSSEELLSHLPLVEIEAYVKKHKGTEDKTSPDQPKPQSS